ncbi:MAG TPA: hypothetical protein VF146_11005 [Bryobacteraceae bacterium]
MRLRPGFLLLLSGLALFGQIGGPLPGQYPPGQYPSGPRPGGYPPNGNPGNNPGSPAPGGGRSRRNGSSQTKPLNQNFSGAIRKADAKSFDLEAEDTRIITFQISDTTAKPTNELKPGDGVDVVATQDNDGLFHAVSVKMNPAMSKKIEPPEQPVAGAAPVEEERTGPPPTIMVRPDDKDPSDAPPKLKRGIPQRVEKEREAEQAAAASAPKPPSSEQRPAARPDSAAVVARPAAETIAQRPPVEASNNPRMALVAKARDVAASFLEGLPNYVCQELTTRYVSETRVPSWNVVDVIGADLVYENGSESYRNLTINGKASKKPPEESGAWSTGEFGTILAEVYSPASAAQFRYAEDDSIAHKTASVYDFSVDRQRSSWKVSVPGQYIMPAYKGSVWVDKDGAHTLRIEMQAKEIPEGFPRVSVETAVDYDYVTLGSAEKFLLPVHAEVLSCARGSNECERNVIEFRNYHKFTGESTIQFETPKN